MKNYNKKGFEIKDGVLYKYNGKGGDVVIPDGVIRIGTYAFSDCSSLTSINIPDSVTEIGSYTFKGCKNLSSINIPDSVTKIGYGVFRGCKNLSSINIPNSVTKMGVWLFEGCSSLSSINIPNSVTKIGYSAFQGCTSLASINIPDSVTIIDDSTFRGCSSLTSINIPNSVTEIGEYAFYGTRIKMQPQGNIAYKGFKSDMTCRDFQYEEGKTYVCEKAKLCECGFHACLNPLDCFNYYYGENVVYHEVILEEQTDEKNIFDSKVCGRKITIGRRLTLHEMAEIFNELNK